MVLWKSRSSSMGENEERKSSGEGVPREGERLEVANSERSETRPEREMLVSLGTQGWSRLLSESQ